MMRAASVGALSARRSALVVPQAATAEVYIEALAVLSIYCDLTKARHAINRIYRAAAILGLTGVEDQINVQFVPQTCGRHIYDSGFVARARRHNGPFSLSSVVDVLACIIATYAPRSSGQI